MPAEELSRDEQVAIMKDVLAEFKRQGIPVFRDNGAAEKVYREYCRRYMIKMHGSSKETKITAEAYANLAGNNFEREFWPLVLLFQSFLSQR